jgi:3-dehydroquinate synthase
MTIISVQAEHSYDVTLTSSWASDLAKKCEGRTRIAVIVSKSFAPDLSTLKDLDSELHVFEVPDGEDGKNIATLTKLWDWLGAAGFTRSDLVIGIGGGAITDLAGFAAASWLRGLDWVAVPTSLAGMVDASVGGKTGINSDYGKNLIGAFHSPVAVLIDTNFLSTLSDRDIAAGMAEVIKCGFIADPEILGLAGAHSVASLRQNPDVISELIRRAITVKAQVVSSDFKESFAREALNYGHTLGHAIEIYSKYQLRHGEAVSIGLVYAAELALARGLISKEEVELHRTILSAYGLPITYDRQAWQKIAPLLALDKKARGNTIRFVALGGIGSTVRLEDLTSAELDAAYERISS